MSDTGGGFGSSGWQIVEADSFDESVLQAGGHREVDEGLAWVEEALNKNPRGFNRLHSASDIYFVKTKLRIKGARVFPAYRLLFSIDVGTKTVTKLHVKACQPEEMPFADDPWDEHEPPF
jgi:hypothetical protein